MALHLQQMGHGMRIAPNKKDCMVLDQAGSIKKFGFIEELKSLDLTEPKVHQKVIRLI
jgi:superfamily II DNA or RNA helicase